MPTKKPPTTRLTKKRSAYRDLASDRILGNATLTITVKGQITLQKEMLRHLNVVPGEKIEVEKLPDGRLVVQAVARTGSIDSFSGSLEQKGGPRLTIAQIKRITEDAWAGKR